MKKKEFRPLLAFREDFAWEVMEQDAEKIRQLAPGFQLPLRAELPPHAGPLNQVEGKTMLSMPLKKEKKD